MKKNTTQKKYPVKHTSHSHISKEHTNSYKHLSLDISKALFKYKILIIIILVFVVFLFWYLNSNGIYIPTK